MKYLFCFISSLIFLLNSCGKCPNGEHCEYNCENNTNDSISILIFFPTNESDSLLQPIPKHWGYIIPPTEKIAISVSAKSTRASIEYQYNNSSYKKMYCYFFYPKDVRNYTLDNIIQQGKLLKRKVYTLEGLKASNWIITYP